MKLDIKKISSALIILSLAVFLPFANYSVVFAAGGGPEDGAAADAGVEAAADVDTNAGAPDFGAMNDALDAAMSEGPAGTAGAPEGTGTAGAPDAAGTGGLGGFGGPLDDLSAPPDPDYDPFDLQPPDPEPPDPLEPFEPLEPPDPFFGIPQTPPPAPPDPPGFWASLWDAIVQSPLAALMEVLATFAPVPGVSIGYQAFATICGCIATPFSTTISTAVAQSLGFQSLGQMATAAFDYGVGLFSSNPATATGPASPADPANTALDGLNNSLQQDFADLNTGTSQDFATLPANQQEILRQEFVATLGVDFASAQAQINDLRPVIGEAAANQMIITADKVFPPPADGSVRIGECADTIDNDGDNLIDRADEHCFQF